MANSDLASIPVQSNAPPPQLFFIASGLVELLWDRSSFDSIAFVGTLEPAMGFHSLKISFNFRYGFGQNQKVTFGRSLSLRQ